MRIKILFASLFLFLIQLSVVAQTKVSQKLIGKWEATDTENAIGSLNFLDSSSIILTIPDQPLPPGKYSIDTTKKPMWLDITIKGENGSLTLKSLLELIDDTTLKWQVFFDGKRTNSFAKETSENTIILKKKSSLRN